jgi:hypothetical protein
MQRFPGMEKRSSPKQLLVGLDSEYDAHGSYTPISTQLFVQQDKQGYFLEHIGRKFSFCMVVNFLHEKYPDFDSFVVVCHFSKAEILGFSDGLDIVLGGGFLDINKTFTGITSFRTSDGREIQVDLVDTFLLTSQSLDTLAGWMGMEKLNSHGYRSTGQMVKWFYENPDEFREYALKDAEITVEFCVKYMAFLNSCGLAVNIRTIGGCYEKSLAALLKKSDRARNLGYWRKPIVKKGKFVGYRLDTSKLVMEHERCYYGGRNEVYVVGEFEVEVYDYDLRSAYATFLSLIQELDLSKSLRFKSAKGIYEYLKTNPLAVGFVDLEFKFKNDVRYPSIPIKTPHGLVFLRSGTSCITLQEFLVSYPYLKRVKINSCTVYYPTKSSSIISEFTTHLRNVRLQMKRDGNTFGSEILKLIVNSGYGKTSQGLSDKKSVDLKNSTPTKIVMTKRQFSRITNPMIASFITGCCRAVIAEYLYYFDEKGIDVCSVTTDGLVVSGRLDENEWRGVGTLSRYISEKIGESIIELKHSGAGYLGIKTRAQALLGDIPQVALTGISTKGMNQWEKGDFLLREWYGRTRFKNTKFPVKILPSTREWIKTSCPPVAGEELRGFNFDYDLKRKPDNVEDCKGICRFQTVPFESLEEYQIYKDCYDDFDRGKRLGGKTQARKNKLVTKSDFERFFRYVDLKRFKLTGVRNITEKTEQRIVANLLHNACGFGIKRISKLLNISAPTVQYWIKTAPISDAELRAWGMNSASISIIESHFIPSHNSDAAKIVAAIRKWLNRKTRRNVTKMIIVSSENTSDMLSTSLEKSHSQEARKAC